MTRSRRLVLVALVGASIFLAATPARSTLTVIGHGQHTEGPTKVISLPGRQVVVGPLTASFSVGLDHAMCAVGEVTGEPAPFNMLVYATQITGKTWSTDATSGLTYTLSGTARSITMVGGAVVEDVLTAFTATAYDSSQAKTGDYFHITIDTVLFPHTTFGKDLDGSPLPLFSGDVAIGRDIAGPPAL